MGGVKLLVFKMLIIKDLTRVGVAGFNGNARSARSEGVSAGFFGGVSVNAGREFVPVEKKRHRPLNTGELENTSSNVLTFAVP